MVTPVRTPLRKRKPEPDLSVLSGTTMGCFAQMGFPPRHAQFTDSDCRNCGAPYADKVEDECQYCGSGRR